MRHRTVLFVPLFLLLLFAVAAYAAPLGGPNFRAHLSGSDPSLQGQAIVSKSPCDQGILFRLLLARPTETTKAYLTVGERELNLYPDPDLLIGPGTPPHQAAYLVYGFSYPPAGMTVQELLDALAAGECAVGVEMGGTTLTGTLR
jgi:hypothetical protein